MKDNCSSISNNAKVVKASEKRQKLFEYLKNSIGNNGFIFLQETYLSIKDKQKWKDDLFNMEKLILVEWQLAILEQKISKW